MDISRNLFSSWGFLVSNISFRRCITYNSPSDGVSAQVLTAWAPQKEINLFLGEKIQTRFQNGFISQTRSLGFLLSYLKKIEKKKHHQKKISPKNLGSSPFVGGPQKTHPRKNPPPATKSTLRFPNKPYAASQAPTLRGFFFR